MHRLAFGGPNPLTELTALPGSRTGSAQNLTEEGKGLEEG